jgi:hypothetical protein
MIECTLMPLKQHGNLFPEDKEKVRYGRYLSSFYPIKGWGKKRWIVAVNVDVDHNKYIKEGMTLEEVAEKCVEFLNTPPKSKYGKRRKRKPIYGEFEQLPYKIKIVEKQDKEFLQLFLIVKEMKRKCFWGKGIKSLSKAKR